MTIPDIGPRPQRLGSSQSRVRKEEASLRILPPDDLDRAILRDVMTRDVEPADPKPAVLGSEIVRLQHERHTTPARVAPDPADAHDLNASLKDETIERLEFRCMSLFAQLRQAAMVQDELAQTKRALEQALVELHAQEAAIAWLEAHRPLTGCLFAARVFQPFVRIAKLVRRTAHGLRGYGVLAASGLFDRRWYLAQNPDVARTKQDPLLHYVREGAHRGLDPSPFFRTSRYLRCNPDVAQNGINPLLHYVTHGAAEGRRARPAFDGARPLRPAS